MELLKLWLIILVTTGLFAASVGLDETYTNSNHINKQKNIEKVKNRTLEKSKSYEKGLEKRRNISTNKERNIEVSRSLEHTKSYSFAYSMRNTITIPFTMLMPEVDFLIKRITEKLISNDKYFLKSLPIRDRRFLYTNYKYDIWGRKIYLDREEFDPGISAKIANEYFVERFSNYFRTYFKTGALKYRIMTEFLHLCMDMYCPAGDELWGAQIKLNISGDMTGTVVFNFTNGYITPMTIFSNKYHFYLKYDPMENSYIFSYKNVPVIFFNSFEEGHFYGSIVMILNNKTNDIKVVDSGINADKLYLNVPSYRNHFDDYFKKLMNLYIQAFKHLKGGVYSIEELKFLIRKYIYEKVIGREDFFERYLSDPTDFWRPNKEELLNYPLVNTTYGEIIYDKQKGIILNRHINVTIEKSSSIDKRFQQLFRNQETSRYAKIISKTIDTFMRENKQSLARLTKSLAVKFAYSKDFSKKQDLIYKATTNTDVLKTLINLAR